MIYPPGKTVTDGHLLSDLFITLDGSSLPLQSWQHDHGQSKAVLIALHGFNDYKQFFQLAGNYLQSRQIISYAYDQRGFGNTPTRGYWSGINAYAQDLQLFVQLVKQKHPSIPIYLLGESMGGAVVILSAALYQNMPIDGIILAAPAIWARQTMPWYQQALLSTLAHTMPDLTLTGKSTGVQASDNIDMLIALGKDPLIIKDTRVEAIFGLANLMDAAQLHAGDIHFRTLYLYGEKDEIIPQAPTFKFLQQLMLNNKNNSTLAIYENGYHMLLRDLQAEMVWEDISTWIRDSSQPLPSGADKRGQKQFEQWSNTLR